jgi:hypothetical protein
MSRRLLFLFLLFGMSFGALFFYFGYPVLALTQWSCVFALVVMIQKYSIVFPVQKEPQKMDRPRLVLAILGGSSCAGLILLSLRSIDLHMSSKNSGEMDYFLEIVLSILVLAQGVVLLSQWAKPNPEAES